MLRNLLTAFLLIAGVSFANAQCNEIFFSEYLEGASNNKAIEIYNPTGSPINLTGYVIYRYNNGSPTPTDSLFPQDILAAGDVWVAGNPSAVAGILSVSDTLHTITFFNGDDAMSIKNISTGLLVDQIGIIGVDPGVSWAVGTGFTNEFTLVRMVGVQQGTLNWAIGATQYDVYPQNTATFLGSHTMNPCITPVNPVISFASAASTVVEGNTTVNVTVNIAPIGSPDTTTADITIGVASTATASSDYTYTTASLTWLPGDSTSRTVTVNILDDLLLESTETVVLEITNNTNNSIVTGGGHTISITDNEVPALPVYPIGDINNVDSAGVGDSLGLQCWIHGVVYGVNLRATGIQFTVIDPTGGIGVFNGAAFPGYPTVTETDSIHILGTINQFNGLLQIDPDSIVLVSTGSILKQPTQVSTLVEANESDLLRFNAGWLVNPTQWTGAGSGFNVDVTDGTNTITVRIDNDVNLYSMPAPVGIFNVCGLGSQFDNSSPYASGYQLMPRYDQDIKVLLNLELGPDASGCPGDSFTFDAGPGQAYLWSNGATTQTITVGTAGTYTVMVTDTSFNVSDSDTVNVVLGSAPVASFTVNPITGVDFGFTSTSTASTTTSWDFGDGNTSTAANPTHTYTANGTYTVTLIVTGPCGADTTTQQVTALVGFEDHLIDEITAYPNPSKGDVKVRFEVDIEAGAVLRVTDLLGRIVIERSLEAIQAGSSMQLETLQRGVHVLEFIQEGQSQRSVLIVE